MATSEVFQHLIARADEHDLFADLEKLTTAVAVMPRATRPHQEALF
jgi:hypothetical protein